MTERLPPPGGRESDGHDPLTGLPGRLLLADRLEVAIAQAARYEDLVALVVVDLDRTTVNRAALGLEAGEELSRMVADHLGEFVRASDTLAYIGNDLFAIVMPRVRGLPQILGLTSRLIKLFDGPWELGGQVLHLTPGVGVACWPENGAGADELLGHAMIAAGHAAREGDQQPHLADPAWHEEARARLALEADLRMALERHEFLLYYQPQVNALTGEVSGLEALVRWRHPTRGLVSPADFIPLAEETRLVVPLGAWVIEEAARRLAAWRELGYVGVRVAVNLAAEQLADEGLVEFVRATLAHHELEASLLEVEVTERTAIAKEAVTARVLEQLKAFGVRLTLDDFGTGYSSGLVLMKYPFDTLKIDRSFVVRAHLGGKQRGVVAAMILVAHAAGMTVVAEGVETKAQLALLKELGADEIQGYYFSPPLPAEECGPFLGVCR